MGDMGYVCNKHAVENGYSVVREIGGHGCGVQFHEEPWVNHIGEPDEGILFVPGMTFTIEPMVNMENQTYGKTKMTAGQSAQKMVSLPHSGNTQFW